MRLVLRLMSASPTLSLLPIFTRLSLRLVEVGYIDGLFIMILFYFLDQSQLNTILFFG